MNNGYNSGLLYYPLTHAQKRIWYIEKIYPNTSLYNIGGPVRIKGPVDFKMLEESINIFIKRNEGLRLRVEERGGQVNQYISKYKRIDLDFLDFSQYKEPENFFNKWVQQEAEKSFALENDRLFYFALFKIADKDNGYFVKFHHIISDGWSIKLMTEQICNTYMKLLNGEEVDNGLACSYTEYIDNESKYLLSDRFFKNKLFWNEKFKDLPEMFLNKSSDIIKGKRKTYQLNAELSSKIKEFSAANKCSLNTFFVTLYLLYLNKTTQQEDIIVGTPVLNRSGKKEKSMFGMFTSTMPFRFAINDRNILETMINVNQELMECYYNQKYPYELLVMDLELKKKGYDNLFNVCINYYNTKLSSELNGSPIENVELYNGNQIYSLQLVIKEWAASGNLTLDFDYKVNDYNDEQIDDIYARLLILINQILAIPSARAGNLSLLSDSEREKLLYRFNATEREYPKDKTIYELFEEQVKKTPCKTAIVQNDFKLTYRELNEKANQVARHLIKREVAKGTIVGLMTDNSIEAVIGILGIIKAGGAYLPIDPGYPEERIAYMLEDSGCGILLTNLELSDSLEFNGIKINLVDQSLYTGDGSNPACKNKPDDLVYVIYTSGSAGKPKGAMIEHRGLVNYIWWAKKLYVKNKDEVFPLYSSLAFDLTVTSIFTPLISGSEIIVYNDSDEEEYVLYRIVKDNRATVIKLTPSQLSLLKDMDNRSSSVRRFIVGGENLKASLAKAVYYSFGGSVEIFNEYGPTETVVGCMIHKYDHERDTQASVPIGIPADNVQIYILDKYLKPVAVNITGEMYIAGDGVARGYLNKPELTRERFINNPFINGKRMYKTGDLAQFLSNGKIEYIGRADNQVKIRGYRIELGEIEKYLLRHEAIRDAVVIDFEGENGGKYLCAYIVKKAEASISELKNFLSGYLPNYMIPTYIIDLKEIPITVNGKIDKGLLRKPEIAVIENTEFTAHRNDEEKILAEAICDVLDIKSAMAKQNFYQLGGDSIKAIQVAAKLNEKGFRIKVKDILSNPIIEDMALYIRQIKGRAINQEPCKGSIGSTPIVSWFFSQNFANPDYYTQSVIIELIHDIETEKLELVMNKLIKCHDSLRINYNSAARELFYNNEYLSRHYKIQEYDLTEIPPSVQNDKIRLIAEKLNSSFNIESDILIKACLFRRGHDVIKLLLTAHHLVVDGVSWRIILDDINTMIKNIETGQEITHPPKTHSYQEWANMLNAYNDNDMDKETSYWENILSKEFNFPADHDSDEDTIAGSCTLTAQLSEDLTECLQTRANTSYNTEPKELLITSLSRTIKEFTGNGEVVIELEGHGREDIFEGLDISRTVGWFTSLYPFYVHLSSDSLSDQIKEVKEEVRRVPNRGMGFGILKYISRALNDNGNKYIRFNYLGDFTFNLSNDYVRFSGNQLRNNNAGVNKSTYIIDINCFIVNGKLDVSLTYSENRFSQNTMKKFINGFINNLNKFIQHCCEKDSIEFTPSDFDAADLSLKELESLFK